MPHILVVEDDESVLGALSLILEHRGFAVTTAENGRAALELLPEVEPDLILLDLWMPEVDGWEFLMRLRKEGDLSRDVPVLVMTADPRGTAEELGVRAYLHKPLELDLLLETIDRHLRSPREPPG